MDFLLLFIISRPFIKGDARKGYNLSRVFSLLVVVHIILYSFMVELLKKPQAAFTGSSSLSEIATINFGWIGAATAVALIIMFLRRGMISSMYKKDLNTDNFVLRLITISLFTNVLSESIVVYGLILFFKTGNTLVYYPLAFISLFLLIIYFPKYREWEEWIEQRGEKAEITPKPTVPTQGRVISRWGKKKITAVIAGLILILLFSWQFLDLLFLHEEPIPDVIKVGELRSGSKKADKSKQTAIPDKMAVTPRKENNILGIELVKIPGGRYMMGLDIGEFMERPVHPVRVGDFYIGRYEVTQAQWREVMGNNPSKFKGCDDCPVENVSWNDVQEFLRKAGEMTGMKLRLPTEAEWEYAAGGGSLHQMWAGTESEDSLGDYSWDKSNSGYRTHPVGRKGPNRFGLHDMSGNVWEWCSDWYDKSYYSESPEDNPKGPPSGKYRALRGGSWAYYPEYGRVTYRIGENVAIGLSSHGFRVAMDIPSSTKETE